ncbi:MAG: hypothetical protein H7070_13270 [Saprospiraceae bacterium]|nr:hypothetical protein [Pyrinomonadaceae bacterium]
MAKTLLYQIFGIGKIPTNVRAEIEREGIVLFDESIRGTVTYLNFRAPGRYSNWKRQWFSSAIVLTKTRLLALRLRHPIIDVLLTDVRFRGLKFSVESENTLLACFDASLFNDDWTGTIEYRFRTPIASELCQKLILEQE